MGQRAGTLATTGPFALALRQGDPARGEKIYGRCFACHGPDPEMRKAGLRLDLAEYAMKKRPGHADAIVPGHPERSELVKR